MLAGLLDEAAELLADQIGRKIRRAAFILVTAPRRLRDVLALVESDPDDRTIAADLVTSLETMGGLQALLSPPQDLRSEVPHDTPQGG